MLLLRTKIAEEGQKTRVCSHKRAAAHFCPTGGTARQGSQVCIGEGRQDGSKNAGP